MATPAGVVPVPRAPAAPAQEPFFSTRTILQCLAFYGVMQLAISPSSPFKSKTPVVTFTPPSGDALAAGAEGGAVGGGEVAQQVIARIPDVVSLWPPGSILDVHIRLSTAEDGLVDFNDNALPSVTWEGIEYGDTKWEREWDTFWDVPLAVQRNGSLWADVFVTPAGISPDPSSSTYSPDLLHMRKILTRYMPLRKIRKVKNLMSGANETSVVEAAPEEPAEVMPIISYYHPNVSIQMVTPVPLVSFGQLPVVLSSLIQLAKEGEVDEQGRGFYYPITWVSDFWLLREHMNPLNETTTRVPLRITLNPQSYMKFQIFASLDDSFSKQAASSGGGGGELDEVKRMLIETNPILLITTVVVSLLHMLFEMLAFTSDITHWRNKKELVGVSVRTILSNCFVQLIILLYLIDNNENTSWMILGGQGMGLVIEAWKITKAVDITFVASPTTTLPYRLVITDKHVLSADELKTQEYDALAFRWVSYGTVPLLVGYTIYSMFYNEHRSWYSFVISTLTSFVYAFGFIQLIPQLIINYKLKSVAHLPMKTLTYKFFNTIVDDFFSFIIKMPILHRLACFRDDVVFLILLYQYWIYPVDRQRANEYGQIPTEDPALVKAKTE